MTFLVKVYEKIWTPCADREQKKITKYALKEEFDFLSKVKKTVKATATGA